MIYAPYLLRHGRPLLSAWQYINDRNLGMSLTHYPKELKQAIARNIWRVSGAGMGCTLFRREILERFTFEASAPNNTCPDLGFAENVLRAGVESFARFDVPVGHVIGARVVWPFKEIKRMEYSPRENMNAMVEGQFLRLRKGKPIELTDEQAAYLTRLGVLDAPVSQPVVEDEKLVPAQRSLARNEKIDPALALSEIQSIVAPDEMNGDEPDEDEEPAPVVRVNRKKTLKRK